MRPGQFSLGPKDVEECASSILHDNIKLQANGWKCRANVLWHVVLYAAERIGSLAAACGRLKDAPGDDAVRKSLVAGLPSIGVLGRRLNGALLDCVPAHVRRRGRKRQARLAIDLTLIPYHGRPHRHEREVFRGQAQSGTTHHSLVACQARLQTTLFMPTPRAIWCIVARDSR